MACTATHSTFIILCAIACLALTGHITSPDAAHAQMPEKYDVMCNPLVCYTKDSGARYLFDNVIFDVPSRYDGYIDETSCYELVSIHSYDKPFIVSLDVGHALLMYGSQVPHLSEVCFYADRVYSMNYDAMYPTAGHGQGHVKDPFTGWWYTSVYRSAGPLSANPFEPSGGMFSGWVDNLRHEVLIVNGTSVYVQQIDTKGILATHTEFLPLDDKMEIRLDGIFSHAPEILIDIAPHFHNATINKHWWGGPEQTEDSGQVPGFYDIDMQKYDGSVLVNGMRVPVEMISEVTGYLCPELNNRGKCPVPMEMISEVTGQYVIRLDMAELGWPQKSDEDIMQDAALWYHQLYDQYFLEKYGNIPPMDIAEYINDRTCNPDTSNHMPCGKRLVTYRDAAISIEIPLIFHDKETNYPKSRPDIGWCGSPLVLVAKAGDVSSPACVTPHAAQKHAGRGLVDPTPEISEQMHAKHRDTVLGMGVQYDRGNAHPMDTFRASLLGLVHFDDIRVLETFPGKSLRDWDFGSITGGHFWDTPESDMWRDVPSECGSAKRIVPGTVPKCAKTGDGPIHYDCVGHVWNSPEPRDMNMINYACRNETHR